MEHFQWKNETEIESYLKENKDSIAEELADVLYWVLLLSDDLKIDIVDAIHKKIIKNEEKYPVSKSKGVATKYTDL